MIDISKVTFSEIRDARPWVTHIVGSLVLSCGAALDRDEKMTTPEIHNRIVEEIWRTAYQDLIGPVAHLQVIVRRCAPPESREMVDALCDQLNSLLGPKTTLLPNPLDLTRK